MSRSLRAAARRFEFSMGMPLPPSDGPVLRYDLELVLLPSGRMEWIESDEDWERELAAEPHLIGIRLFGDDSTLREVERRIAGRFVE